MYSTIVTILQSQVFQTNIEKSTQKNKKDRYQSCEELIKDLNATTIKRKNVTKKEEIKNTVKKNAVNTTIKPKT